MKLHKLFSLDEYRLTMGLIINPDPLPSSLATPPSPIEGWTRHGRGTDEARTRRGGFPGPIWRRHTSGLHQRSYGPVTRRMPHTALSASHVCAVLCYTDALSCGGRRKRCESTRIYLARLTFGREVTEQLYIRGASSRNK